MTKSLSKCISGIHKLMCIYNHVMVGVNNFQLINQIVEGIDGYENT